MTYPPGGPGYPPAQQGNQYAAPTQQFGRVGEPEQAGPSKLPAALTAAVAVFGLGTYAFNFGPMLTISNSDFPQFGSASGSTPGLGMAVAASVLAALLAGIGLLPKQKTRAGLVAVVDIGLANPQPHRLCAVAELIGHPLHHAMVVAQLGAQGADHPHRRGLLLLRVPPRRGLARSSF